MRRRGGLGFIPSFGNTLDLEEKFLVNIGLAGKVVFDIGGWEGVFALYFSKAVGPNGKVVVFEPNPLNCERIKANLFLNNIRNVSIVTTAVGSKIGSSKLTFDKRITSRGTLLESSTMGTIQNDAAEFGSTIQVPITTLDDYISHNSSDIPQFVKIDVEGFEWEVLMGMSATILKYKPDLWIELHDKFLVEEERNGFKIVSFLLNKGYKVHHVETQASLINESSVPLDGHFYCTFQS